MSHKYGYRLRYCRNQEAIFRKHWCRALYVCHIGVGCNCRTATTQKIWMWQWYILLFLSLLLLCYIVIIQSAIYVPYAIYVAKCKTRCCLSTPKLAWATRSCLAPRLGPGNFNNIVLNIICIKKIYKKQNIQITKSENHKIYAYNQRREKHVLQYINITVNKKVARNQE